MKYLNLLLSVLLFLTVDIQSHGQNQNPVDPSFYQGYQWRNIGPQRGGRSLSAMGSP